LALQAERDGLCGCGCGQPMADAWDEDNDGAYTVRRIRCHARAALDAERHRMADLSAAETFGRVLIPELDT